MVVQRRDRNLLGPRVTLVVITDPAREPHTDTLTVTVRETASLAGTATHKVMVKKTQHDARWAMAQ